MSGNERVVLMGGPYIKHMANSENARIFFMGGNGIASTVKNVNTEIDDKRSYRVLSKSEGLFILI